MRGAPGDAEDARIQTQNRARGHPQTPTVSASRARRQRQVVRRIFEQGIPRDLYFVKTDIGLRGDQADGLRIRDEMDLVSTLGKFEAELSGDNAAAAVGRITGDSDLHVRGAAFSLLLSFDGWNGQWLQILHEWRIEHSREKCYSLSLGPSVFPGSSLSK